MNVVTPVSPLCTWLQRLIFIAVHAFPAQLGGLLGLSLIHFARWVMIRRNQWPDLGQGKQTLHYDYVLFCSNFNGTWDQYIDAFSDGIPSGLDLLWYGSVKYPHSIPITAFKNYIIYNQIDTDYYYNATPGAAQRDIKAALKVLAEIRRLEKLYKGSTPAAFAAEYRHSLRTVQNCLGSHGIGPAASLDTQKAEQIRLERDHAVNVTQAP